MIVSIFELFSIGIGPSSSHTMGPMRASKEFLQRLKHKDIHKLKIELYGSLAMTGKGHGTDMAILLGLEGHTPEGVDPDKVEGYLAEIRKNKRVRLLGKKEIKFDPAKDLIFLKGKSLPFHSNAMRFTAFSKSGRSLYSDVYYSLGGGFINNHRKVMTETEGVIKVNQPFVFTSGKELLEFTKITGKSIDELMFENEKAWRDPEEIKKDLLHIWNVMQGSVTRGTETEGPLPGDLGVFRRAPDIYKKLKQRGLQFKEDPTSIMDWVSLFAIAVNEENAAHGRIVTAPTNGAAGIIPAVLHYYKHFISSYSEEGVMKFLLTSAAFCNLFKRNASISGAEMGCQGEVGVACSIAAAGLTAVLGGTPEQIENAAEIGMEHNLGLTCDPIGGLVQIPCIERNTMGALKAINSARLSLLGNGEHHVTLDEVIATMKETGIAMNSKYKETSEGGLAKNVKTKKKSLISVRIPEC